MYFYCNEVIKLIYVYEKTPATKKNVENLQCGSYSVCWETPIQPN